MEIDQIKNHVIEEMANSLIEKLARSAIENMTRMRDALLSGDDSGLKNLWEEYVVQVRGGESLYFEEYQEAVLSYCAGEVDKLTRTEKLIIILGLDNNTVELEEWKTETEVIAEYHNVYPSNDLVASSVVNRINTIAEKYTSFRIERYLNNFDEEE